MTPTWRPLADRLVLWLARHAETIGICAMVLACLAGAVLSIEFNPAFRLLP